MADTKRSTVETADEHGWSPPSPAYAPLGVPPSPPHGPIHFPASPDYIPLSPPSPPCRIHPYASPRRIPTYSILHVPEFTAPRRSPDHLAPSAPHSPMNSGVYGYPSPNTNDQMYMQDEELDYEPRLDEELYKKSENVLSSTVYGAQESHRLSLEEQHAELISTVFLETGKGEYLIDTVTGSTATPQPTNPDNKWKNNPFYRANKQLFDWLLMSKDQRAALASTSATSSSKRSPPKEKSQMETLGTSNDDAIVLSSDDDDA